MSSGNEILYIKGEKNTEVKEPNVTLGDILTMECSNSSIMNRIKPLRILKIPKKEQHRYVVSVLKIIECIHREIPGLQIQNEGESDLIITYEGEKKRNAIWQIYYYNDVRGTDQVSEGTLIWQALPVKERTDTDVFGK